MCMSGRAGGPALHGFVVPEQLVADGGPGAAQHGPSAASAEPRAQRGHRAGRRPSRPAPRPNRRRGRRQQVAGAAGQSTRSFGPPASGASTGRPEPSPPAPPGRTSRAGRCGRRRRGSRTPWPGLRRTSRPGKPHRAAAPASAGESGPVADHDHAHARHVVSAASRSTSFSGASRPDEADEQLAVRGQLARAAPGRLAPGANRSTSTPRGPPVHARHAACARAARTESVDGASVRSATGVQPPDPAPGGARADAEAVRGGEPGDVGLVDGDRRAGAACRAAAARARRPRTATPGAPRPARSRPARSAPCGSAGRRQGRDEREVEGRQAHDRGVRVPVRAGAGADDQARGRCGAGARRPATEFVTPFDLRQETLGDDRDSHRPGVRAHPVRQGGRLANGARNLRSGIGGRRAGPQIDPAISGRHLSSHRRTHRVHAKVA